MSCDPIALPGGARAIVCSRNRRPGRCFACHAGAGYQCDWKLGGGMRCDRFLCPEHAVEVAAGKHLCPEHEQAYAAWKARRAKGER